MGEINTRFDFECVELEVLRDIPVEMSSRLGDTEVIYIHCMS